MDKFYAMLAELLTSKKFGTLIVGIIVTIGAKLGLELDDETITKIVALLAAYLLAQGQADAGKSAAEIESQSPPRQQLIADIRHKPASQNNQVEITAQEFRT